MAQNFNPMPYNFNQMPNNFNYFNPWVNNGLYPYNQMFQIQNQMIMNQMQNNYQQKSNEEDEITDIYNEIKEKKKQIVFTRELDNKSFKVLIPCSLRKNDLYGAASRFKKFEFSQMQLFHKETFLNSDETKIDCINEGDEVKIIEVLLGVDFSCYDSYLSKHENEEKINITFCQDGRKRVLHFTLYTTIKEMINLFFNKMYIPECERENFFFLIGNEKLDVNDENLKNKIKDQSKIAVITVYSNSHSLYGYNGKNIIALIKVNGNQIAELTFGTLELIKNVYKNLENSHILDKFKFKINGKEFEKDDERTLSCIGIRENFIFDIEYKEQQ